MCLRQSLGRRVRGLHVFSKNPMRVRKVELCLIHGILDELQLIEICSSMLKICRFKIFSEIFQADRKMLLSDLAPTSLYRA